MRNSDGCRKGHTRARLRVLAIGYDHPERLAGVSSPKLVINTTAYGTDNFKKYCRKFFGELTGADWRDLQGNFHLFKYGRYVYTYNELKDIRLYKTEKPAGDCG